MFSIEQLHRQRDYEIGVIAAYFPPGARVLELGAGTGQQSLTLSQRGFNVAAVDVDSSPYAGEQVFPVTRYDGKTLPFPDASFDIVFSSNVLEHVRDLASMHQELRRVLKPGGKCVHVLPTDAWRFWTTMTAFPVAAQYLWKLLPETLPRRVGRGELIRLAGVAFRGLTYATIPFRQRRHGERGNVLTEQYYFRPAWWRRHFIANGFEITREAPVGLFYTGHMVWNSLSFERRKQLAGVLGSACHLFELAPATRSANARASAAPDSVPSAAPDRQSAKTGASGT